MVLAVVLLSIVSSCELPDEPLPWGGGGGSSSKATRDSNLGMGNPSNATASADDSLNYLMAKEQFTLSYNKSTSCPNWVSWHLSSAWLGSAERQDNFRADNTLPTGWYRVSSGDYSGSGFDRGHQCPSADRTGSTDDNSATFLMTNMLPQAPNVNRQLWANFEEYCRKLVSDGNELYVVAGGYGSGGSGSNGGVTYSIKNGKINVPQQCWKVVLVLPVGKNDVSRVNSSTRVIAVNTPNSNSVNSSWGYYRTSVDDLETLTGYDFLSSVPDSVQTIIESKVDSGPTK